MYSNGYGVIASYKEAFSLYNRAAEKNNPEAMLALGGMYTSGLGVTPNFNAAKKWFERAAFLGHQKAAFFYATILFRGNKSPADDLQPDLYAAYKWYKIAAATAGDQKIQKMALEIAGLLAKEKLKPEETAKADREAAAWKPLTVVDLDAISGKSAAPP